jgi:hypothetical protein
MSIQLGRRTGIVLVALAVVAGVNIQQYLKGGAGAFRYSAASPQSYVSPADQAMNAKLEPFIECINRVDSKLGQSIPGYRGYFPKLMQNPDSFPDKGGFFHGFKIEVYEQNNRFSRECASGLRKAVAGGPADDGLDTAGKMYADTLEQLIPLLNAADTYYDQGNYKDDKFAKGKELDAQLSPLFDRILMTSRQMRGRVHEITTGIREREIAGMEKAEGKTFNWHTLNFMFLARRSVDGLEELADANKLTADQIKPIEERLGAALEEGRQYGAAHASQKTPKGNTPYWFELERKGSDLLTAIKELRRALSANARGPETGTLYGRVGDAFNSLVRDYNMSALHR